MENYLVQEVYRSIEIDDLAQALVIIGRSDYGPARIPYVVDSINTAIVVFGATSELGNACREAVNYGAQVIAIRINGTHASVTIPDTDTSEAIFLYSVAAESTYNGMYVTIEKTETNCIFSVYRSDTLEYTMTYPLSSAISTLTEKINVYARQGKSSVVASFHSEDDLSHLEAGTYTLTGADEETNLTDDVKLDYLSYMYNFLETYDFKTICNISCYFSDYEFAFYNQLKEFCEKRDEQCIPTMAVMRAPVVLSDAISEADQFVDTLIYDTNQLTRSENIVIVSARYNRDTEFGIVENDASPIIAAMIQNMQIGQSPLINGIQNISIINSLSSSVCNKLASVGIITLCSSIRRGAILSCDTTINTSFTIKARYIQNEIKRNVFLVLDLHEGDPIPIADNALDSKIESYLDSLIDSMVITKYSYTVDIDRRYYDQIKGTYTGRINITIKAVPIGTVDVVTTSIGASIT